MFTFPTALFGGAPPVPPTFSTFNPADKSAFISLSGLNLVATALGGGPGDSLIRGTLSKTTGKWYFELTSSDRVDGETAVGIANGSANVNDYLGVDNNGIGMYPTGHIFLGGPQIAAGPSYVVNNPLGIAVDVPGALIWFRNNTAPTVWNAGGGADPATGTGGVSFAAISGPLFICADIPVQPGVMTLNVGASAFDQPAPTGFSGWH